MRRIERKSRLLGRQIGVNYNISCGPGGVTCPIFGRIRTLDLFSAMDKNAREKRKIAVSYV
jgi:hypothetical protein